jgi:hypothetical protein
MEISFELLHLPFDKDKLLWGHGIQVFPLVVWVVFDSKCLTLAVRVYKSHRHQVFLEIDTAEVA